MTNTYTLHRHISPSDQSFPCSLITNDEFCTSRATFKMRPDCACDWPVTQACTKHLAHVIRIASRRCGRDTWGINRHRTGHVVNVWPMGGGR